MSDLDRFLEMMVAEKGIARSTLCAYETDLKDFFGFLKNKEPKTVVSKDIQDYVMTQKHLAVASVARRLSCLRQFYKFLSDTGVMENPTSLIKSPGYRCKLPSVLCDGDVDCLLRGAKEWEGAEGMRLSALMEILYATGFRVNELVSLSLDSVMEFLKNEKPFLMIRGGGNKDRVIPLPPAALDTLKMYLKIRPSFLIKGIDSPWLFPSSSRQGHLTRQRFGQLLKGLALKVGLNSAHLSPHTVRHAFAAHVLRHGANLIVVQKLLGHSDISTTQIYTHVAQEELAELVEACHPLAKR